MASQEAREALPGLNEKKAGGKLEGGCRVLDDAKLAELISKALDENQFKEIFPDGLKVEEPMVNEIFDRTSTPSLEPKPSRAAPESLSLFYTRVPHATLSRPESLRAAQWCAAGSSSTST